MALPKSLDGTAVSDFLGALFAEYRRELSRGASGAVEVNHPAIRELCGSILDALGNFDETNLEPAVAALDSGIGAVRDDLLYVAGKNEESVLKGQSLYRLRKDSSQLRLRRDLFHIPFPLFHLAPSLRYSVRGSPCLYLANSIYTCWHECRFPAPAGCPPAELARIFAARFELAPGTQVLDLCYPPSAVAMALGHYEDPVMRKLGAASGRLMNCPLGPDPGERARYLASYLAIWPLLAATSLRVPGESDGVKPEYIIPQVLMAWLQRSSEFAGVRYFSTREKAPLSTHDFPIDYALPAKGPGRDGYCDFLRMAAACTEPLSFGAAHEIDVQRLAAEEDLRLAESKYRRHTIIDDGGGMWQYFGTGYCNLEYVLQYLPAGVIEEPAATAHHC